jgi:hypothetical protein
MAYKYYNTTRGTLGLSLSDGTSVSVGPKTTVTISDVNAGSEDILRYLDNGVLVALGQFPVVITPIVTTYLELAAKVTGSGTITVWTYTLAPSTIYRIQALVTATDGTNYATFRREFVVYRTSVSAAIQQGDTFTPVSDTKSDPSWNVTISLAGNDVLVRGIGGTNVTWSANIQIFQNAA